MSWDEDYHRWSIDELQNRVRSMIARGVVSTVDDALKMQVLGLKLEDGHRPTKVEHWHPYGMTYHPHEGAEVVAISMGGNRDHIIAMPGADRRYRIKGLQQGELAIHDDQGQKVHFKRDGVAIETSKNVNVKTTQTVTVESPNIKLGDPGASNRVMLESGPATKIWGV